MESIIKKILLSIFQILRRERDSNPWSFLHPTIFKTVAIDLSRPSLQKEKATVFTVALKHHFVINYLGTITVETI